ncbi:MAG: tetratricopeptide repeat protein [Cyclobacteriaceae bacterium]|nr:tetratricopeptide repeat protein [Cyclobacteriaceae bacterium]
MTKSRLLLFFFIVAVTAALYMMPRYVVDNEQPATTEKEENPAAQAPATDTHSEADHHFIIPDSMMATIGRFYDSYKNAENQEKRFIFADSLAKAYKSVGKLDSTAKYLEIKAIESPSIENFIIAGDGYYQAFNFAVDKGKSAALANKAQEYYKRILEENPALLDIKAKLAMTYVVGASPMQGIQMLQEVLQEDPNNVMAIYNLGMLSITSGQLDKAIERFKNLKQLDPQNPEAHFYLGYCYFELGNKSEAKKHFQEVLDLEISGELVDASKDYLKRIN